MSRFRTLKPPVYDLLRQLQPNQIYDEDFFCVQNGLRRRG